jgi:hypothetical protein
MLWQLPTVVGLFLAAGAFLFHSQQATETAAIIVVQHRIFAMTLALVGAARLWAIVGDQTASADRAWLLLLLLFGVELLMYTDVGR